MYLKTTTTSVQLWSKCTSLCVCVLTDIPGSRTFDLLAADEVPDAGHPVSQQGEHGHEQSENHSAVLRVPLQLLQQPQQPEQPDRLQQVDPEVLHRYTHTTAYISDTKGSK